MHELLEKLIEAEKTEVLKSPEALKIAAQELGVDADEVAAAIETFDGFPLSNDELLEVTGGRYIGNPNVTNKIPPFKPVF